MGDINSILVVQPYFRTKFSRCASYATQTANKNSSIINNRSGKLNNF